MESDRGRKLGGVLKRLNSAGWRPALRAVVVSWQRNQLRWLATATLIVWATGATLLHLIEGGENPAFASWGDSLWNVWVGLFSGMSVTPSTAAGRLIGFAVILSGVALAGLFTASVASILIERALRSREVTTTEMSGHLVLCNWSSHGLEWIREVHSDIVADKRPVVIIHDDTDDIVLPDKADERAFTDVYIVRGDPANEVILRRARVAQAHSVVVLSDGRQGPHADGKTIVCCIAIKSVLRGEVQPNIVVECNDPKYRPHLKRAGADEIISATEFGVHLIARASLFHGMTRVYQELLTVGRDANEMYLLAVPAGLLGREFVEVAGLFLADRSRRDACLLIGIFRGERMMLNPVAGEVGLLKEGDELILLCPEFPDLKRYEVGAVK